MVEIETAFKPAKVMVAANRDNGSVLARATTLAQQLDVPLVTLPFESHNPSRGPQHPLKRGAEWVRTVDDFPNENALLLLVSRERLELCRIAPGGTGSVYVDFVHGATGYRRRSGRSCRQPLARAIGVRKGVETVIDATAGLARDSFLLACLGCSVTAVERSPVLGLLIRDGLERALGEGCPDVRRVVERITLIVDDARKLLSGLTTSAQPDAVYLDPMYPPTRKGTLGKKEMRLCRLLVGDDVDAVELLTLARRSARRRVVVKRPLRSPPLAPDPAIQYAGTRVRYDVYLVPG